jgi:hypothetical protein
MSQKFSHTLETHANGAMHSRKSRCPVKNGNGCADVKSSKDKKNPLRPGKILAFVRKLLLKLGVLKPGSSYHRKKIIEYHTDWDFRDGTVSRERKGCCAALGIYGFINVADDSAIEND